MSVQQVMTVAPQRQPISQNGYADPVWVRYFNNTRVQFLGVDTTSAPVTLDLRLYNGLLVIKDIAGNASVNNITLSGTIEGIPDPVMMTNYAVVRLFGTAISGVPVWVTW